ncbi:MAG: Na+/H+ antiporter [Acidobacteriaceae bacterium]|nr:Na+/H+ antiporter [Acidobacteriaceae bacterium]
MGSAIHGTEGTLLALVILVALLAAFAQRLKTPYPIVLVLGGLVLSFFPRVPHVSLNPAFVFLVVLPPLLFASSLNTAWREFRYNLVSISMLGIGLVAFTVAGVAVVSRFFIPDFDWRVGAVLGAVLSTTDAIAVSAIARRVGLPHQELSVIEGESLANDATGLLALQFTTALVVTGETPSLWQGVTQFLWLILAGIGAGLLIGALVNWFDRSIRDTALQLMVGVATPYFAYLLGESLRASGVLATVACGLYLGRKRSESFTTEARLDSRAVWNTIDFALNSLIFIVVGLQLPAVLDGMRPLRWSMLIGGAAFICAVVIGLRMLWMFPGARISYFIRRRILHQDFRMPRPRELFAIVWSGLRGVLTLAAALSLPEQTDSGAPFPHRAAIIFLAYSVILVTLVGQGLSLPWLLRRLGISGDSNEAEERAARRVLLEAALRALKGMPAPEDETEAQATDLLKRYYRQRLQGVVAGESNGNTANLDRIYHDLYARLRLVERQQIAALRTQGRFQESILQELEKELDLTDLRWSGTSLGN